MARCDALMCRRRFVYVNVDVAPILSYVWINANVDGGGELVQDLKQYVGPRPSALTADSTGSEEQRAPSVTAERFRQVMSQVPTAVSVVATNTPTGPCGLAVGTFASVSLEPPLVGFFIARTSTSWPRIERAGRFAVSVLAEHDTDSSQAFAVSGGDKFAGLAWHTTEGGQPVLDEAVAWFDCRTHQVTDAGDHLFVLGHVDDLWVPGDRRPLIFWHGAYQRLGADH
jgi:3-hydroxy-9,10-secoandrosta-1,3,5(10)-triene-9,17-dione monooxygenase reductase component